LSGSIAAFRIDSKNVPVTDPTDPTMLTSLTEGMQRSTGLELDAVWQAGGRWRVMSNYAYTDAKLTADIPMGALAGSTLAGVPSHSGRLWVDYDMRSGQVGWRMGTGLDAAAASCIDQESLYKTAGYTTFNASSSYSHADTAYSVAIKLAIKNVLNT
jgi:iron complex outermembrane receptor protein